MLSKYHLKGSLVVKWFLSYTASMLVLILIFYIAYFNVADIARGKKEELNRFMLESIQRELDSILIRAESDTTMALSTNIPIAMIIAASDIR